MSILIGKFQIIKALELQEDNVQLLPNIGLLFALTQLSLCYSGAHMSDSKQITKTSLKWQCCTCIHEC